MLVYFFSFFFYLVEDVQLPGYEAASYFHGEEHKCCELKFHHLLSDFKSFLEYNL